MTVRNQSSSKTQAIELPEALHSLFWDCDFRTLSWEKHRDFIVARILQEGNWQSVQWLRKTLGDASLKQWLIDQEGSGLPAHKLRFWELKLDLDPEMVTAWLESRTHALWEGRTSR